MKLQHTLEYLHTILQPYNIYFTRTKWKTPFHVACKKGQFDNVEMMVNNQFRAFSINLNAQHVNGMTPFDLDVHFISSKKYMNVHMYAY